MPFQSRENNPKWKGGIVKRGLYIRVLSPDHPRADANGYVKRSVLEMEKKLGRPVLRSEVVHHINGDKLDDRPENLELFPSNSQHMAHHLSERNKQVTYPGEKHYKARLTDALVREIRIQYQAGVRICDLAREIGVGHSTIAHVVHGHTWKHVGL